MRWTEEEDMWRIKDIIANIFLTLDIENDGLSPLLVDDGMREDAGDEEEPVSTFLKDFDVLRGANDL